MQAIIDHIYDLLMSRLDPDVFDGLEEALDEIADGPSDGRFASLISLASRSVRRCKLEPTPAERQRCAELVAGWDPRAWTLLETVRVALILARSDLAESAGVRSIEEAFQYADEGELCALYRSLCLLPKGDRFSWRAGEGCRSNMLTVFEAIALDNPYPVQHLDDTAWRQLIVKAIFMDVPVWRIWGLDSRLSSELARMALDLVDERRSAGRPVQLGLWLSLGEYAGERGIAAMEAEYSGGSGPSRRAAVLAMARAGAGEKLRQWRALANDSAIQGLIADALRTPMTQSDFGRIVDDA
jgi:hypothetical protein